MDINNVRNEINRQLREQFTELVRKIRDGEDPEELIKKYVDEIHNKWTEKAVEYARKVEEQRKADRIEFERKLTDMRNAFEQERHTNRQTLSDFTNHLIKLENTRRDHEQFVKLKGEALIESFGRFYTALENLLDRHEDVEIDTTSNPILEQLREQCQDVVNEQTAAVQDVLTNKIYANIPIQSICDQRGDILSEIRKIREKLFDLHAEVNLLTPEFWDAENVASIGRMKSELKESEDKLLRMLGECEVSHKKSMQDKLTFTPRTALTH